MAAIAGKTLRLDIPASVELTLVQGTKDGITAYWGTFYGIQRYTLPEGAAAYTMDAEHHLYRLGTDGRTIPAGVAVVIISDKESITLELSSGGSTVTINGGSNILQGSNSAVPVSGLSGTPYVLSKDANGAIGFRQYVGSGSKPAIPAQKAYYVE